MPRLLFRKILFSISFFGTTQDDFFSYSQELSQTLGDDKSVSEHLKLPIQRINDYQLLLKVRAKNYRPEHVFLDSSHLLKRSWNFWSFFGIKIKNNSLIFMIILFCGKMKLSIEKWDILNPAWKLFRWTKSFELDNYLGKMNSARTFRFLNNLIPKLRANIFWI